MADRLRMIVLGGMGRIPFAGMAWEVLHYLEGLRRLGHDVFYIEDTNCWSYDPRTDSSTEDCSHAVRYVSEAMEWAGFSDRWAYRAAEPDGRIYGLTESRFASVFSEADVLINHGASTRLRDEHLEVPVRALVQTDPGGDEILAAGGDQETLAMLSAHTHFFNWGENFGAPDCRLPGSRFSYRPTRIPVVLDWFTSTTPLLLRNGSPELRFTTIGNWQQPGEIDWQGEVYAWSKHHQFMKFLELPKLLGCPVELALGSVDEESVRLLVSHGWRVVDAEPFGTELCPFREFILRSDGEFTVAKDQYVRLRTGWFSDRSAYYLTAGKPVITQDTGFGKFVKTGEGLFAFNSIEEIVAAFESIRGDYGRHSRAARAVAEEYFRAETVLKRLVDDLDN